ncbi:unnamed protein product [Rotaria sp. Silwood2]|nr:unnamed protein product [Rotaria sp. Silwood2]CAF4282236.1 unnamed protein product [Rotaria sp. Silwood2]
MVKFVDLDSHITEQSPHDFRKIIEKQFKDNHVNTMDKSTRIRRVTCSNQRVDIVEIDYHAGDYTNKANLQKGPTTFTFLLYRRDIKNNPEIYENDYPLNTCGCLGYKCAHRYVCCSIS